MNFNIDNYGGKSIVPLKCGNMSGTAFFISRTQLLTATHLLGDAIEQNAVITVKINHEKWVECSIASRLEDNGNPSDVTLLNYSEKAEYPPLELLSSSFHDGEDLKIIGYPMEIGNGFDYFGLNIRAIHKINDDIALQSGLTYDVVAVRNDLLDLYSYGGFSGSPILNEYGKVVGVATDQLYNSLSFTSIKKIGKYLKRFNIRFIEDDDRYDPTPYGNGYAHKKLDEKLKQAGRRYSRNFHIPNSYFDSVLSSFCHINTDNFKSETFDMFKILANKLHETAKQYILNRNIPQNPFLNYDEGNKEIEELMPLLIEEMLDLRIKGSDTRVVTNPDRAKWNKLRNMMESYLELKNYEKGNVISISAAAGMGKTHSLCKFIDDNRHGVQFYLFFGNEFKDEKPKNMILDQMGWTQDAFKELNGKMKQNNKYAIFVIDGINEGAGYFYWIANLKTFLDLFQDLDHLKVIISYREMRESDELRKELDGIAEELRLSGFEHARSAIEEHLDHYKIKAVLNEILKYKEFSFPLYLRLFCDAFRDKQTEPRYITRDEVYRMYLKSKNRDICRMVDEKPDKDITNAMIDYLVNESVTRYQLADVPVENAIKRSNRLVPYRTWSKNLLHILFQENILKEYKLNDYEKTLVGLEFDSIGDYLKMRKLTESLKETDLKELVLRISARLQNKTLKYLWPTSYNVLKYIFTDHRFNEDTLKVFMNNDILKSCFLSSLPEMHIEDEEYRKTIGNVLKLIMGKDRYLSSPKNILYNFESYHEDLISSIHDNLMKMSMAERDMEWTMQVNELSGHPYAINRLIWYLEDSANLNKLIIIIGWMLTSTVVNFRAKLIKVLRELFRKEKLVETISHTIDLFKDADDPYIMQGITAAAYAALVLERNSEATRRIADEMLRTFYADRKKAPTDLIIRNWTMKSVELAYILDSTYNGWEDLKKMMPFNFVENPLEGLSEEPMDEGYFGETSGGKALYHSLFLWDFARYVIGTNNYQYSPIFHFADKGNKERLNEGGVNLTLIQNAIARIIKDLYGYSDTIGNRDKNDGRNTRFSNGRERIGKKYQWLGLYRVLCYLCDNCSLTLDRWSDRKKTAQYNFPWLTGYIPHTDHTLTIDEGLSATSEEFFDKIENEYNGGIDTSKWTSKEDYKPTPKCMLTDKKGRKWLVLQGFDTQSFYQNENRYVMSVWYNTVLVRREDRDVFLEWCRKDANIRQDFMNSGHYDYMWNDYPTANAYTERHYDINLKKEWGCPCDVYRSVEVQLQEYFEGSDNEDEFLASAYSPHPCIMQSMKLHNAERGVIKDEEGNIIALNINPTYSRMSAMVIRRDKLDEYLKEKDLCLFYFLSANKQEVAPGYKSTGDILLECLREYNPDAEDQIKDIKPFDTYSAEFEEKRGDMHRERDLEFDDLFEEIKFNIVNSRKSKLKDTSQRGHSIK